MTEPNDTASTLAPSLAATIIVYFCCTVIGAALAFAGLAVSSGLVSFFDLG